MNVSENQIIGKIEYFKKGETTPCHILEIKFKKNESLMFKEIIESEKNHHRIIDNDPTLSYQVYLLNSESNLSTGICTPYNKFKDIFRYMAILYVYEMF